MWTTKLATMNDDERLDWASRVLEELTDIHAVALELQGWKIVNKDEAGRLWPFDGSKAQCPLWCEDIRSAAGRKN